MVVGQHGNASVPTPCRGTFLLSPRSCTRLQLAALAAGSFHRWLLLLEKRATEGTGKSTQTGVLLLLLEPVTTSPKTFKLRRPVLNAQVALPTLDFGANLAAYVDGSMMLLQVAFCKTL